MPKKLVFHNPQFEYVVRETLNIYDRSVLTTDALSATNLDLTTFVFSNEDIDTLSCFINLERLRIISCACPPDFLKSLSNLKELDIDYLGICDGFDFDWIKHLKNLCSLWVSGGDYSNMNLVNSDALMFLPNLSKLYFHEFGGVDLSPLKQMQQLEHFFCGYADDVRHIDALKYLTNLKSLELVAFDVNNLDFLDNFPDDIELTLSLNICGNANLDKLSRFKNSDIYEMKVNGKYI